MNAKKIENRLAALKKKHKDLADQVVVTESYPSKDTQLIKSLKRRKCWVKTRIARLEQLLAGVASTTKNEMPVVGESPTEVVPEEELFTESESLESCPRAA